MCEDPTQKNSSSWYSWLVPCNTYLLFSFRFRVSPTVRCAHPPSTQVSKRKWEIGLAWENQLNDDGGGLPGDTRLSFELFRAAAAEFLGTLLLLYNGKT